MYLLQWEWHRDSTVSCRQCTERRVRIDEAEQTQFNLALQGEQYVPSLQVSVDDVVLVQVGQSLQSLTAHLTDLLL